MQTTAPLPWRYNRKQKEIVCTKDNREVLVALFHPRTPQAVPEFILETCNNRSRLEAENETLRKALKRAVPWLGKLIADNGHLQSVAPNDAIGALQQAEAALEGTP